MKIEKISRTAENPRSPRKPRADAQRNRELIIQVAKEAFTQHGAGTSLDDIAKQAGVGAGTLYRHFPTREALLGAVYRAEVEKLADAAEELCRKSCRRWTRCGPGCTSSSNTLPPRRLLRLP